MVHLLTLAGGGGLLDVLGAEVAHVAAHLIHVPANPVKEGLGHQVAVDGGQEPNAGGGEDIIVEPYHPVGHLGAGEDGGRVVGGPAELIVGQVCDDGVVHQVGSLLEGGDLVHVELLDGVGGFVLFPLGDSDVVSIVVQLPPDFFLGTGTEMRTGAGGATPAAASTAERKRGLSRQGQGGHLRGEVVVVRQGGEALARHLGAVVRVRDEGVVRLRGRVGAGPGEGRPGPGCALSPLLQIFLCHILSLCHSFFFGSLHFLLRFHQLQIFD